MSNKLKLKEIIELMEFDDPRNSLVQKYDNAKKALMQLSDEYDSIHQERIKVLIDSLIEQLQNIYKSNKVF